MSNELIHDVEESLKQERLHQLWKEYGPYLVSGVILAILFTALISGWRSWQNKVNASNTGTLVQAMSSDDVPAALEGIVQSLQPGQRAVAYLSHAGILLNEEKTDEALAVLKQAAADKSLPAPYGDLARLQAVRLAWGKSHDEQESVLMLASLQPLLDNPAGPWHWHARLQAALILGQDLGDYTQAGVHLAAISNTQNVPSSLAGRARALGSVYALEKNFSKPSAETGIAPEKNQEPEG